MVIGSKVRFVGDLEPLISGLPADEIKDIRSHVTQWDSIFEISDFCPQWDKVEIEIRTDPNTIHFFYVDAHDLKEVGEHS